jgi:hypothetical protein
MIVRWLRVAALSRKTSSDHSAGYAVTEPSLAGPTRRTGRLVMRASGYCANLCRAGSVELRCPPTDAPDPAPEATGKPISRHDSFRQGRYHGLVGPNPIEFKKCDGSIPVSFRKQGTAGGIVEVLSVALVTTGNPILH